MFVETIELTSRTILIVVGDSELLLRKLRIPVKISSLRLARRRGESRHGVACAGRIPQHRN